ncbi:hypothetical protein LL037_16530 [Clostridium estertheticum]|uniref:Uncharacterized protein n=1 Tax=Clostridium estertheticum TaxID=238834 RepID=A0AA47I883_9CLOT|nr:hypothetical protein [Clostridium estertheticum]MBU3157547.1 hypothetical protein [Clostridium estertheticum]MBU3200824.1 hypothetical protein [Clostridium estertheticum]WAG61805.1 hypothetical protein LL038_06050 [Clostridium estertheticum]WAG64074.1 hypothetical protein LL037_16530 [Clostridium estertheticum]
MNNLVPENLINSIPHFKSQSSDLLGLDEDFLKKQLLLSEKNKNIMKLSRGEGRINILNSVIRLPNILFDWGEKSMHSFFQESECRDFLEPDVVNKEMLFRLLDLYGKDLKYHYNKNLKNYAPSESPESIANIISNAIKKIDSHNDLLIIKEWICYALHTAGNQVFKEISPWVSTSMGGDRYKSAYYFGAGNRRYTTSANMDAAAIKKFVILDYWVPIVDEKYEYRNSDYIGNKLRSMGIPWYPNRHNEVMVKYALFPHQLIGYYSFENGELKHYFINHHYLEEWKKSDNFKIGDSVYIDQEYVNFSSNSPYRVIYSKVGRNFSTAGKR